jgi:hypothetical protein
MRGSLHSLRSVEMTLSLYWWCKMRGFSAWLGGKAMRGFFASLGGKD